MGQESGRRWTKRRPKGAANSIRCKLLDPTDDELVLAARWAMTHDVSDTFRTILKHLLRSIDHEHAADRL